MSACDVIFVKKESYIVTSPILVRYKHKAKRHHFVYLFVKDEKSGEWLNTGVKLELLAQRNHLQIEGAHTELKQIELEKQIEKAAEEKKPNFKDRWMKSISKNISALESLMVVKNSQKLFEVLENLGSERFEISFRDDELPEINAHGYYWSNHDHVVVSDVDGTISRSDLLGHIVPRLGLGLNWRHPGVVKNTRALANNGYKLIYLTARPISMVEVTKKYITSLRQDNEEKSEMPFGPVLTSPYHMVNSFAVEVVLQQPHLFKIQLMTAVARLFDKGHGICAAFGNKPTDETAYATLIEDTSRIFTINARGQLRSANKTTYEGYSALSDKIQEVFPSLRVKELVDEKGNVPVREDIAHPDSDKVEKKEIKQLEKTGQDSLQVYAEDDTCGVKRVYRVVRGNAELGALATKQISSAALGVLSRSSNKLVTKIIETYSSSEASGDEKEGEEDSVKKEKKRSKKLQLKRRRSSSVSSTQSISLSVASEAASEEPLTPGSATSTTSTTSTSSTFERMKRAAKRGKEKGKIKLAKTLHNISRATDAMSKKVEVKAETIERVQKKMVGQQDTEVKVMESKEGEAVVEQI